MAGYTLVTHCRAYCFATCASSLRMVPCHTPYLPCTVRASQRARRCPNPMARTTATSQAWQKGGTK